MACGATLTFKRTLEFDPLHSHSVKRQRCMPCSPAVGASLASPMKQCRLTSSPFASVAPKLTTEQITSRICTELKRLHHHRRRTTLHDSSSPSPPQSPPSALFQERTDLSSLSAHRRLVSRDNVLIASQPSSATSSTGAFSPSVNGREAPLLTLRQVGLVCERMLKEREEQLREEYDKVLNDKLNEQYEAFLKFNHDQLHRKFGETPASYVS